MRYQRTTNKVCSGRISNFQTHCTVHLTFEQAEVKILKFRRNPTFSVNSLNLNKTMAFQKIQRKKMIKFHKEKQCSPLSLPWNRLR